MATKKASSRTKTKKQHTPDYYPVVRDIPLGVFNSAISATTVGDAGQILSIANRRLMRYGMNYQIKIDLDPTTTIATPYQIEVYALMNNWDVQRAYALAKDTWSKAHADELESGNESARWMDFRIRDGVSGAARLQPVRYDQATQAAIVTDDGEHVESSVDKGGTETFFTWGNASATQLSVLAEWEAAGRTGDDPSVSSPNAPYDGVNSDGMSNIEQVNVATRGNSPPYSAQSHADLLVKVATLRYQPGPDGLQRLSTGYFDAPCGLFVLKTNAAGDLPNGIVHMEAKSGDYKGVSAEKMCQ